LNKHPALDESTQQAQLGKVPYALLQHCLLKQFKVALCAPYQTWNQTLCQCYNMAPNLSFTNKMQANMSNTSTMLAASGRHLDTADVLACRVQRNENYL